MAATSTPATSTDDAGTTAATEASTPEPTPDPQVSVNFTGPSSTRSDIVVLKGTVDPPSARVRIKGRRVKVRHGHWKLPVTLPKRGANKFRVVATRKGYVKDTITATVTRKLSAAESVHLLDVRQPWEHDLAALPGSQLVPLDQLVARTGDIQPAPGATVVVYCHHGIRSRTAATLLEQRGFADVVSLAGGIEAWSLRVDPNVPRY